MSQNDSMTVWDWLLVSVVLYSTFTILSDRRRTEDNDRLVVEEPRKAAFQNMPAPSPVKSGTYDLQLAHPSDTPPTESAAMSLDISRTNITDPKLELVAMDLVRSHAAGFGDDVARLSNPVSGNRTILGTFTAQKNEAYLQARLRQSEIGSTVPHTTLREVQLTVYKENPGELPHPSLVGGNDFDVSDLCSCKADDPDQHVKVLNDETVRRVVDMVMRIQRDASEYRKITSAWQQPLDTASSAKTDTKSMEFTSVA